ncbi:MAG: BspA family leucine-rich repeat surface protein [Crocinitomicaceae bacterium]|nr:BspA family leucine-rich repeat surface protein [Crocinitomicaceae bacterium]
MKTRSFTKYITLFIGVIFFSFNGVSQNEAFITEWNTAYGGINDQYYIHFVSSGYAKVQLRYIEDPNFTPPYTIGGNNTIQFINIANLITSPVIGVYELKIIPFDTIPGQTFHYFNANTPYNSAHKLTKVIQWGTTQWSSFENSFDNCIHLEVTCPDSPNLGSVTNMSYAFAGAQNISQFLSNWDVSTVTNMKGMFAGATTFNQNISGWNVSNVTIMDSMFAGASSFDQDLGNWDVSNVTSMDYLFAGALSATGMIKNDGLPTKANGIGGWDVSKVTSMQGTFQGAVSFNQDIGGWDVSKVVNMQDMFSGAVNFNQEIGGWDVSNVTNMEGMFDGANKFNQSIGGWDVSKVTTMKNMFRNAAKFNQDIGGWDVSKVKTMENLFKNAQKFNQNIGGWDVSKVGMITGDINDVSFDFSGMDCAHYGATLRGWAQQTNLPTNIIVSSIGRYYPTDDATYRNILMTTYGWSISGDLEDATCTPLSTEINEYLNYSIHPNPVNDHLIIDNLMGNETISIVDLVGKQVNFIKTTSNIQSIDVSNLANGIYSIVISYNGNKFVRKIVKN